METPTLGDIGLLASTLTEEDCAIVISYSGNNMAHMTMSILPHLEKKGVPIIALTSDGDNLLRDYNKTLTYKLENGEMLEAPRWINSRENRRED